MGVETICLSIARGEHFLLASRPLIDKLERERSLSQKARGVVSSLRSEYTFLSSLLKQLRYKVRVAATYQRFERVDERTWKVPVKHIARNGIRPTILLGENTLDGDVYVQAAHHYKIHSGMKNVQVSIEPRNGNGAGVSKELQRIVNHEKEFCLCLTDSDRFSAGDALGEIAAACSRVVSGAQWVVNHETSISRELENTVPWSLVDEAMQKIKLPQWAETKASISDIGDAALQYGDFKEGTSLRWAKQHPNGSPANNYWSEIVRKIPPGIVCDDESRCGKDVCECFIAPKIAKNLVEHVLEFMTSESAHEVYRRAKSSHNFSEWLRLGQEVLEIAAAPKPMRM